eukprot:scaffold874_cov95-Isochrysis_galbana.AAC.2
MAARVTIFCVGRRGGDQIHVFRGLWRSAGEACVAAGMRLAYRVCQEVRLAARPSWETFLLVFAFALSPPPREDDAAMQQRCSTICGIQPFSCVSLRACSPRPSAGWWISDLGLGHMYPWDCLLTKYYPGFDNT